MLEWLTSILKTIAEKLFGEAIDWKKAVAWMSTWAAAFAVTALTFLRGTFSIKGWVIAAVVAYTLSVTVIAVVQLYRAVQRQRGFREVRVEESHFGLEWRLRMDPEDWAHTSLSDYSPSLIRQIVAGPFHLSDTHDCSAEVSFMIDPVTGSLFRPVCLRCEPAEYRSRLENADEVANAARLAVAGELQRIFRTGKLLSGGAVKLDASGTTGFLARPRRRSA
jgi:hypothetical protein